MPFPFGGHPTLSDYIRYAGQQGCTIQYGYGVQDIVDIIIITNPANDKHVIVSGVQQSEHLAPSEVSRLDRRLGLNSPFAKQP